MSDELDDDDKERVRELLTEYEDARTEEDDAASRAAFAMEELGNFGIDPNDPPDWTKDDE